MTTLSHPFGFANVTASINYFLKQNLGTNLPDWMTFNYGVTQPRTLNFYWPDQPLNFPSFSVTHHSSDPVGEYEGDRADGIYKAIERQGLMEINCWVLEVIQNKDGSQTKNQNWMLQLQQMRDMVFLLFQQNRSITLYDCSNPNSLQDLHALIRVRDIRDTILIPDPNPAVKRVRIIITFRWKERWVA
jgi:hypothetical protein